MTKFGLAQPVRRVEDPRLLKGNGRYTDDIVLPGMLQGYVLRSPHAAARIVSIDTTAAAAMPGVHAVYTAADLKADGIGPLVCAIPLKSRDGSDRADTPRPALITPTAEGADVLLDEASLAAPGQACVFYANTRIDAARIGFDDDYLYKELTLTNEQRSKPILPLASDEAAATFELWTTKTDKVPY